LQTAEANQRDVERQTSSSGGGSGAGPGQRTISLAFALSEVHEAWADDTLGRWINAAKLLPSALEHLDWPIFISDVN
jgi:hypothetical protein